MSLVAQLSEYIKLWDPGSRVDIFKLFVDIMQYLECTYIKILIIVYLKVKFN
jgi:hypothetical protein